MRRVALPWRLSHLAPLGQTGVFFDAPTGNAILRFANEKSTFLFRSEMKKDIKLVSARNAIASTEESLLLGSD